MLTDSFLSIFFFFIENNYVIWLDCRGIWNVTIILVAELSAAAILFAILLTITNAGSENMESFLCEYVHLFVCEGKDKFGSKQ